MRGGPIDTCFHMRMHYTRGGPIDTPTRTEIRAAATPTLIGVVADMLSSKVYLLYACVCVKIRFADVKLGDLGAARNVKSSEDYTYIATTDHMPARWLPLEAIRDATFSHKSDVFSFGVLMWEVSRAVDVFVTAAAKHAGRNLAIFSARTKNVEVRS